MEIDMAKQIVTRNVKISTVMRSAAFMRGFNEARKGVAMDYDVFTESGETSKRWNYERGRLFGFVYAGAIKTGAKVNYDAIMRYAGARHLNWVR